MCVWFDFDVDLSFVDMCIIISVGNEAFWILDLGSRVV